MNLYRFTTRWPEPGEDSAGLVHGNCIPGVSLPLWRASACAAFIAFVGRTSAHVYERLDHPNLPDVWRWKKTFWGD